MVKKERNSKEWRLQKTKTLRAVFVSTDRHDLHEQLTTYHLLFSSSRTSDSLNYSVPRDKSRFLISKCIYKVSRSSVISLVTTDSSTEAVLWNAFLESLLAPDKICLVHVLNENSQEILIRTEHTEHSRLLRTRGGSWCVRLPTAPTDAPRRGRESKGSGLPSKLRILPNNSAKDFSLNSTHDAKCESDLLFSD